MGATGAVEAELGRFVLVLNVGAVDGPGAMHLADRSCGKGALVEVGEHLPKRHAELLAHQLLQTRERHRRDTASATPGYWIFA